MLGKILIFCMSTKQQKQGIDRIESTKKIINVICSAMNKNRQPEQWSRKQKCGLCHVMISLYLVDDSFFRSSFDNFFSVFQKILNITFFVQFTWNSYHVLLRTNLIFPTINGAQNDKSLLRFKIQFDENESEVMRCWSDWSTSTMQNWYTFWRTLDILNENIIIS